MKKDMIIRRIGHILVTFLLFFAISIIFAYFRGEDVNVPEELITSALFCVIYFPIIFYLQRKKKAENADNDSGDAE